MLDAADLKLLSALFAFEEKQILKLIQNDHVVISYHEVLSGRVFPPTVHALLG